MCIYIHTHIYICTHNYIHSRICTFSCTHTNACRIKRFCLSSEAGLGTAPRRRSTALRHRQPPRQPPCPVRRPRDAADAQRQASGRVVGAHAEWGDRRDKGESKRRSRRGKGVPSPAEERGGGQRGLALTGRGAGGTAQVHLAAGPAGGSSGRALGAAAAAAFVLRRFVLAAQLPPLGLPRRRLLLLLLLLGPDESLHGEGVSLEAHGGAWRGPPLVGHARHPTARASRRPAAAGTGTRARPAAPAALPSSRQRRQGAGAFPRLSF